MQILGTNTRRYAHRLAFAGVFLAFLAGTLVGGVTFAVRRALNDRRKRRAAKAAADATKTPPLDAGREGGSQSPP